MYANTNIVYISFEYIYAYIYVTCVAHTVLSMLHVHCIYIYNNMSIYIISIRYIHTCVHS